MEKIVIFDTNAYRSLTYNKKISETITLIRAIRQKEIEKNITVYVSPTTVWFELFAHLAEVNDKTDINNKTVEICLNAIVASYLHSLIDEKDFKYRMMPDSDTMLTELKFNYGNPRKNEILNGFGKLVSEIYNDPTLETLIKHKQYLEKIKAYVEKQESEFITYFKEMAKEYKLHIYPNSNKNDKRKKMLKNLEPEQLFNNLGNLIGIELSQKIEDEKKYFPAAFYLRICILKKFICNADESGFDISKKNRANWVWDHQLLYYISKSYSNILITDDIEMKRAATSAGIGDKIIKLQDYKILIGI